MKNKFLKTVVCAVVCGSTALMAAGCNPDDNGPKPDPETRPLMFSTAALDGNFNPFTYTAQADGDIIANTQIGMFTNDNTGDLICGQNEATVALDYAVTMYDSREGGNVTANGTADGRTEYDIVIKNGIQFSDGTPLTIKDVLFNLYVYLDVAYTGSSTIYSTDIQGLKAYRAQDPSIRDTDDDDIASQFNEAAMERVYALLDWLDNSGSNEEEPSDPQMKADLDLTKRLFRQEIESDWTAIETTWTTTYEENYNFNAAWEAYLFNENIVRVQTRLNTVTNSSEQIKGEDGKYVTWLDPNVSDANNVTGDTGDIHLQHIIDEMAEATSEDKIAQKMAEEGWERDYALLQLQREFAIETVYETYTDKSEIGNVLQFWATASSVLEDIAGQERTKYYQDQKNQGITVDNVSGIKPYSSTGAELNALNLGWRMHETFNASESYSVLKVVINGIDPKAIFNLAFTVAPMHYYSGEWNGKNYVRDAMNDTDNKEFGVEVGNSAFFQEVISSPDKNGLPVGAGVYKASTRNGGAAASRNEFYNSGIVYFERNEHFGTVGTGLHNAYIKYVRFQVTPDDQIMTGIVGGQIDYATPSAKESNKNTATTQSHLAAEEYDAGGYGYVGVNPKFVKNIYIRRAIMSAMNTREIIRDYYTGGMGENIWRPVSTTSWAYPRAATEYADTAFDAENNKIIDLVENQAGYHKGSDGIYTNGSDKLKFTFTIAGDTTDHPAYNMFVHAAEKLNALGFDITVSTSSQALKDMTRGNLAVWAAAWSSSIDPDPYQVYHKNSNATSVNNWNYSGILNPSNSEFNTERNIVNALSDKIDEGRQYLEREDRTPIYAECYDLIMSLAVELPTYQRKELWIYNRNVLDRESMTRTPSAYNGPLSRLWELNYVK